MRRTTTRRRIKRKRPYTRRRGALTKRQRGYVRTTGFYGRFNGATKSNELKFHDIAVADTTIAQGGVIQNSGSINLIAQGTGESERIGRKCNIRSINWRYLLQIPESTAQASTSDTVRVIMYLDMQANGATTEATGLDILETSTFQSFNNLANSGRFRILVDRTHDLNAEAAGGNGTAIETCRKAVSGTFFKKCNIPLEFSSTTGAITEIRSNNLGVLLVSRSGLALFSSQIRLRFADG